MSSKIPTPSYELARGKNITLPGLHYAQLATYVGWEGAQKREARYWLGNKNVSNEELSIGNTDAVSSWQSGHRKVRHELSRFWRKWGGRRFNVHQFYTSPTKQDMDQGNGWAIIDGRCIRPVQQMFQARYYNNVRWAAHQLLKTTLFLFYHLKLN